MKIKDILAQERPSVSFEVFPPRKDAPFEPVKDAVAQLAQEQPSFMSVTYGASGNAQANTAAYCTKIRYALHGSFAIIGPHTNFHRLKWEKTT